MSRFIELVQKLNYWKQPWQISFDECDNEDFTFLVENDDIAYRLVGFSPRPEVTEFLNQICGKHNWYYGVEPSIHSIHVSFWKAKFNFYNETEALMFLLRWSDKLNG